MDSFAQSIISSIDHAALPDTTGALKSAAQEMLKADDDLLSSSYVNPKTKIIEVFNLDHKLHGVNTFLPGPDFDIRAEAENLVGPKQAQSLPLKDLLEKEIKASLPDDAAGDWANFVRTMRSNW